MAEGETPQNLFADHPMQGHMREILYNVNEHLKKIQ